MVTAGSCSSADSGGRAGTLTVFAAASLTDAFTDIGAAFEHANPGVSVAFSFASSSTLAAQINQGAPVDVFAAADISTIEKARERIDAPSTFATNKLSIIVAKGNPKGIRTVADLARGDVVFVSAAAGVPVGVYAQQVFAKAKVSPRPKSLEVDVKAIAAKVTLGEADAGIVYETDVKAVGDRAQGVAIPDELNVIAKYPIAVLTNTKARESATAFVAFLSSSQGRDILARYGFGQP